MTAQLTQSVEVFQLPWRKKLVIYWSICKIESRRFNLHKKHKPSRLWPPGSLENFLCLGFARIATLQTRKGDHIPDGTMQNHLKFQRTNPYNNSAIASFSVRRTYGLELHEPIMCWYGCKHNSLEYKQRPLLGLHKKDPLCVFFNAIGTCSTE